QHAQNQAIGFERDHHKVSSFDWPASGDKSPLPRAVNLYVARILQPVKRNSTDATPLVDTRDAESFAVLARVPLGWVIDAARRDDHTLYQVNADSREVQILLTGSRNDSAAHKPEAPAKPAQQAAEAAEAETLIRGDRQYAASPEPLQPLLHSLNYGPR